MQIRVSLIRNLLAGFGAALVLSACGGGAGQDEGQSGGVGDSVNADSGTFVLEQSDFSVDESAGSLSLVVRRTGGSRGVVNVQYQTIEYGPSVTNRATAMASGTGDFQSLGGGLRFADGETRKTVSVEVADDSEAESDKVFGFRLTGVDRGRLGQPSSSRLTIVDDDGDDGGGGTSGQFQLSASSYTVAEDGGTLTVVVERAGGAQGEASVRYSTSQYDPAQSGNADDVNFGNGDDYDGTTGRLDFGDGQTEASFQVSITDDAEATGNLTFGLYLFEASTSLGSPSEATVTIVDDEQPGDTEPDDPEPGVTGEFRMASSNYYVSENGGSVRFVVQRVNGSDGAASVDFATAVTGSGDGHAVAGEDYTSAGGTLEFTDGETERSFSVPVIDDEEYTGALSFAVRLSNADTAMASPSQATVQISDDEQEPTESGAFRFNAASYSVAENVGSITITVERVNGSTGAASVDYATQVLSSGSGAAVAGTDFQAASGTLDFADGVTTRSFQVAIIDDGQYTGNLSFQVSLSNADTAVVSPALAAVSIVEDESQPQGVPTLVWDAPTTNADGSCLDDLDGFRVNYGLSSGNYTQSSSVALGELQSSPTGNSTSCGEVVSYRLPLDSLNSASWYVTVQSRDSDGNLSDHSAEIVVTVN
ncbi:hypothetical protein H0Z60_01485 [Ectothiorhodospiraceae bacterium WFHF3C12]|nr:hypothetical protein [Ectothiorhodospiraceae bacterium WFHF3C12]